MVEYQLYDSIGAGYARARKPDPHVFAQVLDALGDANTVINVGAGTGNYEPDDRVVLAVEPNPTMAAQRTSPVPVVRAFAETLPVATDSFDVALAMFTIHHWPDPGAGVTELRRVARRQVALVYDTAVSDSFWLLHYFAEIREPERLRPTPDWIGEYLHVRETRVLAIPGTCSDGFAGCYWNRPERYLDADVQAGMSVLARHPVEIREAGTARLRSALDSGEWDERFGYLRDLDEFDIGYRLVICE